MKPKAPTVSGRNNAKRKQMNTMNRKLRARFEPDTRFEVRPLPVAPFRATAVNELEQLKDRLLRNELAGAATAAVNANLRRAANEAAALAWITKVPLLIFPALFEEKARTAYVRLARQELIRERSRELLAA